MVCVVHFQAVECQLANVKPAPDLSRGQWHPAAREWLMKAILEEEVLAKVRFAIDNHLKLLIVKGFTGEKIGIS